MTHEISTERLRSQRLAQGALRRPADVVAWFGAVQAQEYGPARWALALRMKSDSLDASVTRAFDEGLILRTHVMRPTWHFVTPDDIRWLLDLTAPQIRRRMAPYERALELNTRTITRAIRVVELALAGRRFLMRSELGDRLESAGLGLRGQRLGHLMMHAELNAVVCSGPRRGKQFTYALLDERAPVGKRLARDEAVGELTRRYFRSHGPATARDFMWWSGLTAADARRGLEMIRARPVEVDGQRYWRTGQAPRGALSSELVHLLPIYDEYLVAYRDREAVPHGPAVIGLKNAAAVTFQHALVIAGQVAGTWRVAPHRSGVRLQLTPLRTLTPTERRETLEAVKRYEQFLSCRIEATITGRA